MNVKPIITSLLVLFLWSCGTNDIDPECGDRCVPKWWKDESSNSSVVYGYGREASRDAGTATALSLAAAQSDALNQINTVIESTVKKGVEEGATILGEEEAENFAKGVYAELAVNTAAPCNYCTRNGSAECTDCGKLWVFTRVKVNIDDYLNQDLRDRMNDLLQKSDAIVNDLKNK